MALQLNMLDYINVIIKKRNDFGFPRIDMGNSK